MRKVYRRCQLRHSTLPPCLWWGAAACGGALHEQSACNSSQHRLDYTPIPPCPQLRESSNLKYSAVPREQLPPATAGYGLRTDWVLRGHAGAVDLSSCQGNCIATVSFDGTAKLWRVPVRVRLEGRIVLGLHAPLRAAHHALLAIQRMILPACHIRLCPLQDERPPAGSETASVGPGQEPVPVLSAAATYVDPPEPGTTAPPLCCVALAADCSQLASGGNDNQVGGSGLCWGNCAEVRRVRCMQCAAAHLPSPFGANRPP